MKRWGSLLLCFFVFLGPRAFPQSTYFKTYGKVPQDYFYNVQKTLDGGFILSGISNGYGGSNYLFMVKTDANGDTNWVHGYVTGNTIFGSSVFPCADSGYAVAGIYGYARVDKNGNMLWQYTYATVTFNSIRQTADGGFILAGSVGQTNTSNGQEVYLLKTDINGIKQWSRKLGGPQDEYANSIRQTADGGYIFVGGTTSYGAGGWDVYLVKTNANGDTLWTRTYGGPLVEGGVGSSRISIEPTFDGGYILGGYTTSFSAGGTDAYLIKTDVNGNLLWSKNYGGSGSEMIYDVKQCADSGYVFTGYTSTFGGGSSDVYLVRTNASGDTLFTRTYGGALNDNGQTVIETGDKGFAIAGYTNNYGAGNNDGFLLKTDSMGNTSCHQYNTSTVISPSATQVGTTTTGKIFITLNVSMTTPVTKSGGTVTDACIANGIENNREMNSFSVYPNPGNGSFTIHFFEEAGEISITDVLGNEVPFERFPLSGNEMKIEMRAAAGTYLLKLRCKSGLISRKLFIFN